MSIQFYKPNKNNTGHASSFSQSPKDNAIYATILKQAGWDTAKGIGTFADSRTDPTKNISIKLGQVEIGAILDAIDRNRPFSSVHDTDKQFKSIQFGPWVTKPVEGSEDKPVQRGFSFSITVSDKQDSTAPKNALYIGFSYAEARLIREYLISALHKSFETPVQSSEGI